MNEGKASAQYFEIKNPIPKLRYSLTMLFSMQYLMTYAYICAFSFSSIFEHWFKKIINSFTD